MCVCMDACIYLCMYGYLYICVCMHTCIYVIVIDHCKIYNHILHIIVVCMYVCMHACVYVYTVCTIHPNTHLYPAYVYVYIYPKTHLGTCLEVLRIWAIDIHLTKEKSILITVHFAFLDVKC